MITFWLVVIGLILLGLLFVLLPLLSKENKNQYVSREEINKAIYIGKVEDLEADLERNLLDKEEYDHALADLQQTLLQDADVEDTKPFNLRGNKIMTLTIAIVLPVVALLTYKQVSTGSYTYDVASNQTVASSQMQSIENSIASLEKKLKEKPDSVEGWRMLGQSYFVTQQYELAKQAYIKALDLVNQADPEILVLTAEASAFSNNELFSDYEKSLLAKALSINPNHQRGLWYSGYAAYTTSDFQNAVNHWQTLLTLVPNDRADVKASLVQFLNDARSKAGLVPLEQAEDMAQQDTSDQRKIEVSVQLNESVNQLAGSGDTLFIYARAVDGPKMPLSLARLTVASLPAKVTLSKEMAMMPSMDIDTFEKVEVLARISKSGQAITQKGDLISKSVVVDFSETNIAAVNLDISAIAD
ncbi:MAG: c-type cytochrome biogenesis protein CcmI [Gammaproteobacteria bacterium]|nr:c-type cytochrome biogenesis protein CcmI [Gammaproteobacteria bacterium]